MNRTPVSAAETATTSKSVTIKSPAKINLSIDVTGKRPDGMHEVDMIMQSIGFYDEVTVTLLQEDLQGGMPGEKDGGIVITCDKPGVPLDRSNICWKAAELMRDTAFALQTDAAAGGFASPNDLAGTVAIDILKRIPVAAGMAGGSGNGAAVLHALNMLWGLGLTLEEMMELGGRLGADVPFCVLAQAAVIAEKKPQTITVHRYSSEKLRTVSPEETAEKPHPASDSVISAAARALGTGTEITQVTPLTGYVAFAKPAIGVSTKEAYRGIDRCEILRRPDNDKLAEALAAGDRKAAAREMINVLELYTLEAEPEVARLKQIMESELGDGPAGAEKVLMSGSGPTVFALFGEDGKEAAEAAEKRLRELGYEAYSCAL